MVQSLEQDDGPHTDSIFILHLTNGIPFVCPCQSAPATLVVGWSTDTGALFRANHRVLRLPARQWPCHSLRMWAEGRETPGRDMLQPQAHHISACHPDGACIVLNRA